MATHEERIEESELAVAIEAQEFNLVKILNPKITIDGNQWCILHGENLQDRVAGFGPSPILAVYAFNKAWQQKLTPETNHG